MTMTETTMAKITVTTMAGTDSDDGEDNGDDDGGDG